MSIQLMPASSARLSACAPGGVVLVDQDAADPAAAEHQLGDLEPGLAERAIAHLVCLAAWVGGPALR